MSTYRVPKCGRHFVKFDDVTIYPVLVVARTVYFDTASLKKSLLGTLTSEGTSEQNCEEITTSFIW